ncbi:MAG TPA: hypothetical protein VI685_17825 [Candidatus Angelobacter sp.]
MKTLWSIAWALALALLLAEAGAAQDKGKDGVTGYEVFSSSTPDSGETLDSQGLNGVRTPWFITHVAPGNPAVVNMVITYYDSKESRDKAKEKENAKNKKDEKKKPQKEPDPPPVPTYDPRFYDYKDGKLVPKTPPTVDPSTMGAMNTGNLTANGGNGGGRSDTTYDKFGNPSTPTYDPRFFEYKDGKLMPKSQGNLRTSSVEGLVVPDTIYDQKPFSFAMPQISGEVVNIQTVEGVVVQNASTDRYGRVFLAAGLPAGAYLISRANQPLGKIEIKQGVGDALLHAPQPVQLQNPPQALKLSDPFSLTGHGFSPNCADMKVSLTGSGKTEEQMVLAATEDQLKLAPVQQLQPGAAQLRVTDSATGNTTAAYNVLLYDIQGNLVQRKLTGGEQTELVVTITPGDLPLTVKSSVVSGPVDFGHGRREAEAVTSNGQAIFPVHANHGSGPFRLNWELAADQDFVTHDECRCNINIGRCQPEEDYFCIERRMNKKWACISSHKP